MNDQRASRAPDSNLWLLWSLCLRIVALVPLFCLALPGMLMWTPVFWACRVAERSVMRRRKKPTHRDEIAQYKMMCGWVLMPPMITTCAAGIAWWRGSFIDFLKLIPFLSLYVWATVRLMEEVFATLRAMFSLFRLLLVISKDEHLALRKVRDGLFGRVVQRAELAGDIKPPQPPRSRGFWFDFVMKFSPVRRRKKDWNEVLRLQSLLPVDMAAIERERAAAVPDPPVESHPLAQAIYPPQ